MGRRFWVVVVVALVVCVLGAGRVLAQVVDSPFENRARLLIAMDNDPERVVAALEQVLTAEQAVSLEALLVLAPDDRDKADALEAAKRKLYEAGLADSDSLLLEIESRLVVLKAAESEVK